MFASRISGTAVDELPSDMLPGEFAVGSVAKRLTVNGQMGQPGDLLLCDAEGVCRAGDVRISCDRSAALPEESDAVGRLGAEVDGLAQEWQWEGLLAAGVVDPGWEEDLGRHPLEDAIKECLPYLRNVFHKPIRHLRIDKEPVLTSKARRLAKGAPDYLATHPEDWDGRTVLGVKPKRILAKVRHEELDIYENRLAARLVDYLSRFLARRIRRLREIEGMLAMVGDFGDHLRGHHRLQERIAQLWADAAQASRHLHEARELGQHLARLRTQLLGLMDSELYHSIPRRAKVAGQMQMTNILRNDANYRYVAKLWQKWYETAGEHVETEAEFYLRMQKLHGRFGSVVAMFVARALAQLGFTTPTKDGNLVEPGSKVCVRRGPEPCIPLTLRSCSDMALLIEMDGQAVLRIAPIFFGFLDLLTDRDASAYRSAVSGRAGEEVPCVVVYPGSLMSKRSPLSETLQANLTFHSTDMRDQAGMVRFLPVSPYDITSVERLARCMSWYVFSRLFGKYPVCVTGERWKALKEQSPDELANKALLEMDRGACVKSLPDAERLLTNVADKCGTLERKTEELDRTAADLEIALRGPHHDRGIRGQLRAAKERSRNASELRRELTAAGRELQAAISHTTALATCLYCGTVNKGPHDGQYRSNSTFEVQCSGCSCSWGLGLCGACHKPFPFIRVAKIEECLLGSQEPGWQEMSVGQDMLATPRLRGDGSVGFECPWCGHI